MREYNVIQSSGRISAMYGRLTPLGKGKVKAAYQPPPREREHFKVDKNPPPDSMQDSLKGTPLALSRDKYK